MLLLVLVIATLFVGCKKRTTCELCEKKAWCEKFEYDGESCYVCSDCKEDLEELIDFVDGLGDLFD